MASQKLSFLQSLDAQAMADRVADLKAKGHGFDTAAAVDDTPQATAVAASVFSAANGAQSDGADVVISFSMSEPDSAWTATIENGSVTITDGLSDAADATITMSDADLGVLSSGEMDARALHQKGRLRIDGNVLAAHRIGFLFGLSQ